MTNSKYNCNLLRRGGYEKNNSMRYRSATNKNAVSVALLAVLFKCVLHTDVLNERQQCSVKCIDVYTVV